MTPRSATFGAWLAAILMLASMPVASAQNVASRSTSTPVILTITGPGGSPSHDLTLADLEKLPKAEIRTTTPWHDGVQHFEGVSLQVLMESLKLNGANAQVVALNRYRTTIPTKDFSDHKPILAYRRNGAAMEVREKGPLFVIYPYDANAALKNDTYFSRSAWQVRSISVE